MAQDKRGRTLPKGIRQRGDNYEGRFTYKGISYSVTGRTIGETQQRITELRYRLDHGMNIPKERVTFGRWFDIWIEEYKKGRIKGSTIYIYKAIYTSILKDRFEKMFLVDMRPEHIQKLINDMIKAEYEPATIKLDMTVLRECLQQAYKNGLIDRNPVDVTERPTKKEAERRVLSKEEQDIFMTAAKGSYLYNLFAVMLRTGMRSGEMRALRYSDIDKEKNVIHVQRTLQYVDGHYVENTPKTQKSKRDIPMTAAVLALLEAQRTYWGFKVERIDRFLFCNENGNPLGLRRIQSEIDMIIKKINEDEKKAAEKESRKPKEFKRFTSHTFRHTFATRAIESGMNPQTLKTILGHSSLAMTMDLYSHVLPDTKAAEMDKIEDAF